MDVLENIKLFLRLYYRPLSAMSGIIDKGSWLFSAALALAIAALLEFSVSERIFARYEAAFDTRLAEIQRRHAEFESKRTVPSAGARQTATVPAQPQTPQGQPSTSGNQPSASHGQPAASQSQPAPGGGQPPANQGQPAASQTQPPADDDSSDETTDDDDDDYAPVARSITSGTLPLIALGWPFLSFTRASVVATLLGLALLYVPSTILVLVLMGQQGSFAVVFRRDYGSLLTCSLMAWSAAHLPLLIIGLPLAGLEKGMLAWLAIWMLGNVGFGALMVCALRTLFGASFGKAIATISISWVPVLAEPFLMGTRLMYYLASPFLLFYGYQLLRGEVGDLGMALSRRQSYRRHLECATVNPRDAEAHYQLGIIYQQRHQYAEAIERFKKAVAIDPREIDAQYQLGIIARSQGRLQEAIDYFNAVVALDDRHALSEIWREIGATYLAASMLDDAREALERFVERREYDAQGLYLIGETLLKLKQPEAARSMFERCIEAASTTPYYRRGDVRRWSKLAQRQVRTLSAGAHSVPA
jgi:hypothetical protein